ncbi:hypothetical protein BDY19DRAFT_927778 [Irpex rosettiformis]|uniref:Uncharacterized protein n=1 Tax=Irpex rosettiformis TaxID=378272 RepID=A0ACB8UCC0_9APHY|nr:hypothetical protein BDY19DRAFT_927778 [Irpex rosettiformis]
MPASVSNGGGVVQVDLGSNEESIIETHPFVKTPVASSSLIALTGTSRAPIPVFSISCPSRRDNASLRYLINGYSNFLRLSWPRTENTHATKLSVQSAPCVSIISLHHIFPIRPTWIRYASFFNPPSIMLCSTQNIHNCVQAQSHRHFRPAAQ